MRIRLSAALLCLALPAFAQSPAQLDKAVRFGAIATLGPICGLRSQAWGVDLRRAELQAMGVPGRPAPGDTAQQSLADRAGAALSYAEDEALEGMAEAPQVQTCEPLATDPDLAQADRMVSEFRSGIGPAMW